MSLKTCKLLSLIKFLALLLNVVTIQPVMAEQGGASECFDDRNALEQATLLECFDQSLRNDPRFQENLPILAPYWQAFGPQEKEATFERFRLGYTASEAIAAGVMPRTAPVMRILHMQAIRLAELEFLYNISQDPQLEGLSRDDFEDYRDELLDAFLDGTDNSFLIEFVNYAPAFTEYVLAFPSDFIFSDDLGRVVNIAEQNAIQTEQNAIQTEQNAIQTEQNAIQTEQNAIQTEVRATIADQIAKIAALQRLEAALRENLD